jgi:hypothetical protein
MIMDFEAWMQLFGTSEDDPALQAAITAHGAKKIPKRPRDQLSVQFELKGTGLALIMTDESVLRKLKDQDVGEGPMRLSGVLAKLHASEGRDLYRGVLPCGMQAGMSRQEVQRQLGAPTTTNRQRPPVDIWDSDQGRVAVSYVADGEAVRTVVAKLPNVEF